MTQAQADAVSKNLEARITAKVDKVGPGPGRRHHRLDGDDAPPPSGTPAEPSSIDANA